MQFIINAFVYAVLALSSVASREQKEIHEVPYVAADAHELSARSEAEQLATWLAKAQAAEDARVAALEEERQRAAAAAVVAATVVKSQALVQATPVRTVTTSGGVEQWLAASAWPASTWPTVLRIIACESGGNPGAVSPSGYVGLMQVAPWFHGTVPADPVAQLNQAYQVFLKQGWGAWSCY